MEDYADERVRVRDRIRNAFGRNNGLFGSVTQLGSVANASKHGPATGQTANTTTITTTGATSPGALTKEEQLQRQYQYSTQYNTDTQWNLAKSPIRTLSPHTIADVDLATVLSPYRLDDALDTDFAVLLYRCQFCRFFHVKTEGIPEQLKGHASDCKWVRDFSPHFAKAKLESS